MILGFLVLLMAVGLVFVPLFGGYLTAISGVLAFFVRRAGAEMALVSVLISAVHVLFGSEFIRFNAVVGMQEGVYRPVVVYVGLALLQVAAGVVIAWRHLVARDDVDDDEEDEDPQATF
ncbi:MAG: hypothetical protein G8237_10225 [Magnetococcales bacterium]|nr:hypothetical protein [Magnetococcales bacterium]NGZ06721.1 hypothetical protein [Magnetococcales bacterium]